MDHLCKSPLSKKQRKEIMSSKSDISTKENTMTFRIGIHLLISQDGRVSTIFRQSLEDILDGIDKQTVVQVDIVQGFFGVPPGSKYLENILKSDVILCVLDDVSNENQILEAVKISKSCHIENIPFICCTHNNKNFISIFCDPCMDVVQFEGENPRPDHDLLITEEVVKDEGDGQTKVTCVKKHFLQVGNRILLINGLNDTRVETKIVSVISEKAFKLSDDVKLDCDAYYVVKLLSRNDQDSYLEFDKSFNHGELKGIYNISTQPTTKDTHRDDKQSIILKKLLGSLVGCEIYSTLIAKNRLPTHQWVHINLFNDEESSFVIDDENVSITLGPQVIVLGQSIMANITYQLFKRFAKSEKVLQVDHQKFLTENYVNVFAVVSCGELFEIRSKVAEKCKENNWNFIDSGIAFQQLHIQAIYPGHSELFDTIIDYEDTSDEAPECVIKQFPTHVDHCLQWAVRKVNSLQKENHSDEEVLDFKLKATTKFYKYFITKPKKLLESFPVEESPDTWKAPRKPPKLIQQDENDVDQSKVIKCMTEFYEKRHKIVGTEEAIDSQTNLASNCDVLEQELILCLAKFRAFIYDVVIVDSDEELLRRALKYPTCQKSTATLAAHFLLLELFKLEQNLKSNDWWITERGGLSVVKSRTTPKTRQVGNCELTSWENFQIEAKQDWTLEHLLEHLTTMGLNVSMITQKAKMVYIKAMPSHAKKKTKLMNSVITFEDNSATIHIGADEIDDLITAQINC